jgi:hypothetical protein
MSQPRQKTRQGVQIRYPFCDAQWFAQVAIPGEFPGPYKPTGIHAVEVGVF